MAQKKKKGTAAPEAAAAPAASGLPPERLHKFLASTGAGSRRECETFIEQGRVAVNGKVVTRLGTKVVPGHDAVTLDGEKVAPERKVYYLLNKPPGYVCTNHDTHGRPRAVDLVPERNAPRVYTVGRLDLESRGLILLTNDGAIANIICHPRYRIEKRYEVTVRGEVDLQKLGRLEAGVWLAEGKSSPARVQRLGRNPHRNETLLEMVIFEGRNREIRRVFTKVGLKVKRLVRTRIGPLELGDMAVGHCRILAPIDLRFVYEAERLYLANKEAWDAEFPPEEKPPRGRRPRQDKGHPRKGKGRRPRPQGGARRGYGHRGPERQGYERPGYRPAPRPAGDAPRRPPMERPPVDRPPGERPPPPPRHRRRYYD